MSVEQELREMQRRVEAATARRCEEALRRVGVEPPEPPPVLHSGEILGYALGQMTKAWNEGMAALARGIQRGLR